MELVLLDSDIMIHFFKQDNSDSFKKAKKFIEEELKKNNKFAVTQLTVTEILQGIKTKNKRLEILKHIHDEFFVLPYDDKVSLKSAEIRYSINKEIKKKYSAKHTNRAGRALMFVDIQNIATAVVHNCKFLSQDEYCRELAKLYIKEVSGLPEPQLDLFEHANVPIE